MFPPLNFSSTTLFDFHATKHKRIIHCCGESGELIIMMWDGMYWVETKRLRGGYSDAISLGNHLYKFVLTSDCSFYIEVNEHELVK